MKNAESMPVIEPSENRSESNRDLEIREAIFQTIILNRLVDNLEESLEESNFSDEEIKQFAEILPAYSAEDLSGIVAVPYELRSRVFSQYRSRINSGEMSISAMIAEMSENAKKYGFTIGYHRSGIDIQPETLKNNSDTSTWSIKGVELDDRDNIKMAYYSLDYQNIYRKRSGNYLYVIRAEIGEDTSHKRDQSNNWGRAPMLSVIDQFDFNELESQVESLKNKSASEKNKKAVD